MLLLLLTVMLRQCVGCKVEDLPPLRDTDGDVSSVNPLSERIR